MQYKERRNCKGSVGAGEKKRKEKERGQVHIQSSSLLFLLSLTCMFERGLTAVDKSTTRRARSMGKFSSSPGINTLKENQSRTFEELSE
jgi:hypothetical protein